MQRRVVNQAGEQGREDALLLRTMFGVMACFCA